MNSLANRITNFFIFRSYSSYSSYSNYSNYSNSLYFMNSNRNNCNINMFQHMNKVDKKLFMVSLYKKNKLITSSINTESYNDLLKQIIIMEKIKY